MKSRKIFIENEFWKGNITPVYINTNEINSISNDNKINDGFGFYFREENIRFEIVKQDEEILKIRVIKNE